MAGGKSAYLQNALVNGVLGGSAFSLPSTVYICLSTAAWSVASTGSAMSEATGAGYSRLAVTNNSTNWPAASGGIKGNGGRPHLLGCDWLVGNDLLLLHCGRRQRWQLPVRRRPVSVQDDQHRRHAVLHGQRAHDPRDVGEAVDTIALIQDGFQRDLEAEAAKKDWAVNEVDMHRGGAYTVVGIWRKGDITL